MRGTINLAFLWVVCLVVFISFSIVIHHTSEQIHSASNSTLDSKYSTYMSNQLILISRAFQVISGLSFILVTGGIIASIALGGGRYRQEEE